MVANSPDRAEYPRQPLYVVTPALKEEKTRGSVICGFLVFPEVWTPREAQRIAALNERPCACVDDPRAPRLAMAFDARGREREVRSLKGLLTELRCPDWWPEDADVAFA